MLLDSGTGPEDEQNDTEVLHSLWKSGRAGLARVWPSPHLYGVLQLRVTRVGEANSPVSQSFFAEAFSLH